MSRPAESSSSTTSWIRDERDFAPGHARAELGPKSPSAAVTTTPSWPISSRTLLRQRRATCPRGVVPLFYATNVENKRGVLLRLSAARVSRAAISGSCTIRSCQPASSRDRRAAPDPARTADPSGSRHRRHSPDRRRHRAILEPSLPRSINRAGGRLSRYRHYVESDHCARLRQPSDQWRSGWFAVVPGSPRSGSGSSSRFAPRASPTRGPGPSAGSMPTVTRSGTGSSLPSEPAGRSASPC